LIENRLRDAEIFGGTIKLLKVTGGDSDRAGNPFDGQSRIV
jgi:hypothetical protein